MIVTSFRNRGARISLAASLLLVLAAPVHSVTVAVDSTADDLAQGPNGNCTLREAVIAVNGNTTVDGCVADAASNTIELAPGVYTLTLAGAGEDASLSGDLDVRSDLILRGAGRDMTVIDGNSLDRVLDILPASTLGYLVQVTLQDLTIRNGTAPAGGVRPASLGGGILNQGVLTIASSRVVENRAGEGGGVAAFWDRAGERGRIDVVGSEITGNDAEIGGGVALDSVPAILTSTAVSGNHATVRSAGLDVAGTRADARDSELVGNSTEGAGGAIGGLAGSSAVAVLTRVRIADNVAAIGGGIAALDGGLDVYLDSSVVETNHAALHGGGLASEGGHLGTLNVTASTIRGNVAGGDGGGIWGEGIVVTGSTISANTAAGSGGGIKGGAHDSIVTNSTLSGNLASTGAGLDASGTPIVLRNVTVTGNAATVTAGGVNAGDPGWTPGVATRNAIVAGNLAPGAPDVRGPFVAEGYSLIGIGNGATGFVNGVGGDRVGTAASPIDARLGPLADNGGPTFTHALLAGSLAIDSANPAPISSSPFACPTTDQRGTARPGGPRCDRGAYEMPGPAGCQARVGAPSHGNGRGSAWIAASAALTMWRATRRGVRRKGARRHPQIHVSRFPQRAALVLEPEGRERLVARAGRRDSCAEEIGVR